MRRLAGYTTVDSTTYPAGMSEDELPEGVAEQITNPAFWVEPEEVEVSTEGHSDYYQRSAKDLIFMAKERGIELSSTRKLDVIEALEASDASVG